MAFKQEPLVKVRVKTANKTKVTLIGFGPQKYQMYAWGKFALATVKERVAGGVGSDDAPLPGLKKSYAIRKTKAGRGNRRNLSLTGDMLNAFQVRSASESQVRMDITSRHGRLAARANERRTPWFGFSRMDEKKIFTEADRIFKGNLKNIGVRLRGVTGSARRPIWLDPLGISSSALSRAA